MGQEDVPAVRTAMGFLSRFEGIFSGYAIQYCCLMPILIADILILYLGFHPNGGEMCSIHSVGFDEFAKMAGVVGISLFLMACVLSGVRRGLLLRANEVESEHLLEWFNFFAFILSSTSLPKMVFATIGLSMYMLSSECQSSDVATGVVAWSVFNGMIGVIDIIGIIKNWNYIKMCKVSLQSTSGKPELAMPKVE